MVSLPVEAEEVKKEGEMEKAASIMNVDQSGSMNVDQRKKAKKSKKRKQEGPEGVQ